MKIVFNACNLALGGGRRILTGVVDSLYEIEGEDEIHVFLPRKPFYNFLSTSKIKIHYLPFLITNYFPGFLVGWYILFRVNTLKPDAIFSLGNYAIPSKRRQLLLLQWPYAVYPDSPVWSHMSLLNYFRRKLRIFFFKQHLRYATVITVQTELMKSRLKKFIKTSKPIVIVKSAVSHINPDKAISSGSFVEKQKDEKLFLFVSEYYSHKNLEIILPLAEQIKNNNLPFKIVLTLDESNKNAKSLLTKIQNSNFSDKVVNIGRVGQNEIAEVYRSCDGLLFPTLLETYGFPYLEASLCRLPIFTSDMDFARNMNGENAWYFNPFSAESILECLIDAFSRPVDLESKIEKAYQNAVNIPSWKEITKQYLDVIKQM